MTGGVGSGKYAPCRWCGKSVEQPSTYPSAVKLWCGAACEDAIAASSDWDDGEERIAQIEAKRFQSKEKK